MSARLAPSSRPLPSLFVAFLSFFVFPWPSPLRVIIIIIGWSAYEAIGDYESFGEEEEEESHLTNLKR